MTTAGPSKLDDCSKIRSRRASPPKTTTALRASSGRAASDASNHASAAASPAGPSDAEPSRTNTVATRSLERRTDGASRAPISSAATTTRRVTAKRHWRRPTPSERHANHSSSSSNANRGATTNHSSECSVRAGVIWRATSLTGGTRFSRGAMSLSSTAGLTATNRSFWPATSITQNPALVAFIVGSPTAKDRRCPSGPMTDPLVEGSMGKAAPTVLEVVASAVPLSSVSSRSPRIGNATCSGRFEFASANERYAKRCPPDSPRRRSGALSPATNTSTACEVVTRTALLMATWVRSTSESNASVLRSSVTAGVSTSPIAVTPSTPDGEATARNAAFGAGGTATPE